MENSGNANNAAQIDIRSICDLPARDGLEYLELGLAQSPHHKGHLHIQKGPVEGRTRWLIRPTLAVRTKRLLAKKRPGTKPGLSKLESAMTYFCCSLGLTLTLSAGFCGLPWVCCCGFGGVTGFCSLGIEPGVLDIVIPFKILEKHVSCTTCIWRLYYRIQGLQPSLLNERGWVVS